MNKENKDKEEQLSWFHGKISRENSEDILRNETRENGLFLVRDSSTSIGDFVLSVLYEDEVCHYQIRRHGEDAFFSIKDNTKIHGLDSLIEYYQKSSNGLITQLTHFVKKDPPPNDVRSHGRTNLLHRATKEDNQKIVSELLKCGYRNFDAKNQDGQTAVHLACLNSNEDVLKLLLNAGANVNCRDTAGNTPLHYACRNKPANFIKTLISAKSNIQTRNIETGYVPLHDAAKYGNLEAVQVLLDSGGPNLPRASNGEFPEDLAAEFGHNHIVNYLKNYALPKPEISRNEWYHGTLERTEAAKLVKEFAEDLMKKMQDKHNGNCDSMNNFDTTSAGDSVDVCGIFLIRYSNRSGYVLTLWDDNNARHFIIQQSSKHLYIDEGPYLPSLEHLVQHYTTFSDGLPVNLRFPVPPKPKPPLPLFSTMPKSVPKKQLSANALNLTTDPSTVQVMRTAQRNLSHPGDDAMNCVGLFESGSSPPFTSLLIDNKKNKDKRDMAIFRSLKPRSPKRNYIIDGMRSLRKSKLKSPSKSSEPQKLSDEKNQINDPEIDMKHAETLMKNLCFSSDFINQSGLEGFYNVPKNNCAIVDIDIGETNSSHLCEGAMKKEISEIESDYFTKSDKIIELERTENNIVSEAEKTYFVDPPPPPINLNTFPIVSTSASQIPQAYIPTADIRIFMENRESSKALAESSAELRELCKHPERLDSTTSSEGFSELFQCRNSKSKLHFYISNECLTLQKVIGEGEFGSVHEGSLLLKTSDVPEEEIRMKVAIKTLRDEHCRSNRKEFLREASVMIPLQHHCIVKLLGVSKSQNGFMMVQELMALGSMLNFIVSYPEKVDTNYELKLWASQIACGMEFLESRHFVHRDLAARNILLASRNQAKISDFGLSRALGSENDCYQASQGGKWPIKWYAPESYNHGLFSHASDVWSFGVTLWEMFSLGEPPFYDLRGVDAIQLIEEGKRLLKPQLCPDHVYKIMESCWNYKPKDRPCFRYLKEFFSTDPGYQNLIELVKTEHIS